MAQLNNTYIWKFWGLLPVKLQQQTEGYIQDEDLVQKRGTLINPPLICFLQQRGNYWKKENPKKIRWQKSDRQCFRWNDRNRNWSSAATESTWSIFLEGTLHFNNFQCGPFSTFFSSATSFRLNHSFCFYTCTVVKSLNKIIYFLTKMK